MSSSNSAAITVSPLSSTPVTEHDAAAPGLIAPAEKLSRSYDFEARLPDVKAMMSMSGLDYLTGVLRGEMPAAPIAYTLNFWPTEFSHGRAVFVGEPQRFLYNPLGSVHGGWYATLLDSALGCAVHTTLPAGKGYTTVDLSISLVRAITEKVKRVRCEATIVHAGGTIATAQARITDDAGTLYAHGTTTCLILAARG
jgi:uncharacterized protein (TIGR00369 family)